jgi:hypothetical protein
LDRGGQDRTRKGTGKTYRIVLRHDIGERFALAFEEMERETRHGHTILTGEVVDQSHLHGILDRIGALGLELLSVESLPGEPYENDASYPPTANRRRGEN